MKIRIEKEPATSKNGLNMNNLLTVFVGFCGSFNF